MWKKGNMEDGRKYLIDLRLVQRSAFMLSFAS